MFYDSYIELQSFFDRGGGVLVTIFIVTILMWMLILSKYFYLWFSFPTLRRQVVRSWEAREDKSSWYAHQVRKAKISQVESALKRTLGLIRTLIAICPFLGILGTVTGMVLVFDVMALTGTSDARGMASGISRATLPTMAGLVAAISGLYFSSRLERQARKRSEQLADELLIHQGADRTSGMHRPPPHVI